MDCILPEVFEKIKNLKWENLTSTESRVGELTKILGKDTASKVNLLYEKSLLLKDTTGAFDSFLDKIDPSLAGKRAAVAQRIIENTARKESIVKDSELLSIVQDSLQKKYGVAMSEESVRNLFSLSKEVDKLKQAAVGTADHSPAKMKLGYAMQDYNDVLKKAVVGTEKTFKDIVKRELSQSASKIQQAGVGKTGILKARDVGFTATKEVIRNTFGIPAKAIRASWDSSALLRQGWKVLTANPKIWAENAKKTGSVWLNLANKGKMEAVVRDFYAGMITSDLYQYALDAGLAVNVVEEFFPTTGSQTIKILGNVFKASDDAFTVFSQGSRYDLFEIYSGLIMKNMNIGSLSDISKLPEQSRSALQLAFKDAASHINNITGYGALPKALERSSGFLNKIFFSARYQAANIRFLFDPIIMKTPEMTRVASRNLATQIAATVGIMGIASQFGDVGWNPFDSKFGKIRLGDSNQWVDTTASLASYISTALRAAKAASDARHGVNTFGRDGMDILMNFMKGKLAPQAGVIRDFLEGKTYEGETPNIVTTIRSLFVPISLENIYLNWKDEEEANIQAWTAILEILGANVTDYK